MNIEYHLDKKITAAQLASLFVSSGLKRPSADLPRLQKMIDHADLIAQAWHGTELVGVARVLTDFSYYAYLADLAVKKDMQRQGIGHTLMQNVKKKLGCEVTIVLLSTPAALNFYPKQGFEKVDHAFRLPRQQ